MINRTHIRWFAVVASVVCAASITKHAAAIEYFCEPQDFCEWVPRDGSGQPVYHHGDGAAPWVIGGNDLVQLSAGEYQSGTVPGFSFPMIFVVENGTLAIEDLAGGEVGLGAWIFLCDQATFRIRNATYRTLADFPFQYPLFALGQSRVEYQQATIYTLKAPLEASGYRGAFFQVMGYESTLDVVPGADFGISLPMLGDAWELAVVHDAVGTVQGADVFGEFYVAGNAQFRVEDSQYHDMFFEACPGAHYDLVALPELCDIGVPDDGCITPGHPPIDFHMGPPNTSFTLDLVNDKVFSWAAATYESSSVSVRDVPERANFAIGLGGIYDDLEMRLAPGSPPVMEGVTDRTLVFENSHVLGWMVWPGNPSHTKLLEGSEVGDLLPSEGAVTEAHGTLFTGAMMDSPTGTEMRLYDSRIAQRVSNSGGRFWATNTQIDDVMAVAGPTWFADVTENAAMDLREGGTLHRIRIDSPAEGSTPTGSMLTIEGSVTASTADGVASPFPSAVLDAVEVATGTVYPIGTISAPASGEALATWELAGLPNGTYDIRLYFSGDGDSAASVRRIEIAGAADAGVDASPDAAADGSVPEAAASEDSGGSGGTAGGTAGGGDAGDEDDGCGCRTAGAAREPSVVWWLLLPVLVSRWRRRESV